MITTVCPLSIFQPILTPAASAPCVRICNLLIKGHRVSSQYNPRSHQGSGPRRLVNVITVLKCSQSVSLVMGPEKRSRGTRVVLSVSISQDPSTLMSIPWHRAAGVTNTVTPPRRLHASALEQWGPP
ncbi:hypothetical protein PAXRUDRAFT_723105 [Paxillus rubicundulus Ve08.2h10]|uniref:Uncharacterized protein n=1 Tax=Paxillus rubicundulus Ve08.2h10 TaxID=930991 RepID=A0A0D0E818_9AGAM|nr:hypothetical protein PAXRUDRAFT_723105 [Paxillus rubicundulus Ve08.2h10]